MIIAPVHSRFAFVERRLDAKYHCSPGVRAAEYIALLKASGADPRRIAGEDGMGVVAPASRTRRVYAAQGEDAIPYLRPYDVFDYLPQPADMLSRSGSVDLERLVPEPGTLLQTCSGRNLGPLVYADRFLSRFVVSDDMLRIMIPDEVDRLYTFAFLSTSTGQALVTRRKTGGVIDHLSAADLAAIEVPFIDRALTIDVACQMRLSVDLRESARLRLDNLITEYASASVFPEQAFPLRAGWTQKASSLSGRLDAAFYNPHVSRIVSAVRALGGVRVGDVADAFIPGRYKRYYVAPEHGRPIVSGRQLLQSKPVNLRHIAPRSVDYTAFSLEEGMVAFGAEGRAEERISQPALIVSDRAGWLANNHVMRVRPKPGINPGWLYLAFAVFQTQAQVKACSCGSVVDTVYPADLNEVILPPIDNYRGDQALQCWRDFATANQYESDAISLLESAIQQRVT